ncbi:MAG TPA: carboxymuconolactone decarboxylase family protein [Candidatus Dormibacteraeota bacterium]|nr:carboxymuconolactone decarboxylase family protein [Candidatus Dormibacteraeota bacterium]
MARLDPPRRPPLWVRALLAIARWHYGREMRPLQLAAHTPQLLLPFLMTNRFAHGRGTLPADVRLLAMLLVGERNGCHWCIDFGRGLAGERLRDKALHVCDFETRADFGEAERAALRYADEATRVPVAVADATFAALRAHFDERQSVELTFAVAVENFFNRINAPLGIEAEGFCALAPPTRVASTA